MGRRKTVRTPQEEAELKEQRKRKRSEARLNLRRAKENKQNFVLSNVEINQSSSPSSEYAEIQPINNNLDDQIVYNIVDILEVHNLEASLINSVNDGIVTENPDEHDSIFINNSCNTIHSESRNVLNCQQPSENYRRRQRGENLLSHNSLSNLNDIAEHYGGKMMKCCIHCDAKHFMCKKIANKGNSFNDCCSHGKVILEPLPLLPIELRSLFDGSHRASNIFFNHIRRYNSLFSFASFNANLMNFTERRLGPFCFRIQGQIYYQVNTALYPGPNELPVYGQLFIIDSEEAVNHLMTHDASLDRNILETIDHILRENNIFAQSYQMMGEELKNQQQQTTNNNSNYISDELHLMFTLKPGMDRRRYNEQRSNEVAAVFSTNADGQIPDSYVTIRNQNTKELQFVSSMDPNVEPWIYPLFYPFGTQGWNSNLRMTNSTKRITRDDYTKYRMACRENGNEMNHILLGRRLFQQWVVDQFVKIEKDRTEFIRTNQSKIRAESYAGLIDYLHNTARNTNSRVGKVTILPATFMGSPRYMMQSYQDAMAIVRKFGKPDLFITMTCNPKWREITENLLPHQQPSDRPDITARVFDMKKKHLIDLIVEQKFFGEVIAYVYSIESQKRGLLHIHLLVTLKKKLTTPELINQYISAEIPDPELNPKLHQIVMKNMIHGPCGNWCKVNNQCSKRFPKKFQAETIIDEQGYPKYLRRNTGITYERTREHKVNNQWVVPYCPALSLIFNCHINVKVIATSNAPKYIYKYIFKGHDAASIEISDGNQVNIINHDEIRDHIEARYVGPNEAVWRILEKKIQAKSHSIIRLPVHLPNEQIIRFSEDNVDENDIRKAISRATMLMEYFASNSRDENARNFSYTEIPSHYVFKKPNNGSTAQWCKRMRRCDTIGRMYSISPSQKELFHLRLLLLRVKGATSFEHLRNVNGQVHSTYTKTCLALGLIEDDTEWHKAIEEAASWMMPSKLRQLFVRILIHCNPVYPERLWNDFKQKLSEDFERHLTANEAQKKAYNRIVTLLLNEGSDISQYPTMDQIEIVEDDNCESLMAERMEIGIQLYNRLNESQKTIVDKILNIVDDNNPNNIENNANCFYIDGPGGTGKTFVYNTLFNLLKGKGKCVSTMAFTGIAATLLPEGKTVHKTFGLPVPLFLDSTSNIRIQSKQAYYLKNVDLFIWDEAPVAPRYALELIDRTMRDFMNNNKPFGGKIFVLGGDFRQLIPIKLHGTRTETVNLSIKHSVLWQHFSIYSLTQNMRVLPNEIEFTKFLLDVGNGSSTDQNNNIKIPDSWLVTANDSILQDTYGELIRNRKYDEMATCAILSARNIDVDDLNCQVVNLLDERSERIYTSVDTPENDNDNQVTEALLPEYFNSLSPLCLPPHELKLRKYTIIMLIRNLSISEGLCNGTRLTVLKLGNNVLQCKILCGDKKGEIVFLNQITLYSEIEYPFTFKRRQFPVKIAFAKTINKAQGQTFDKISIDLRRDVFTHGQLYVALSRVRSSECLKIYIGNDRCENSVKNYVYKKIFS